MSSERLGGSAKNNFFLPTGLSEYSNIISLSLPIDTSQSPKSYNSTRIGTNCNTLVLFLSFFSQPKGNTTTKIEKKKLFQQTYGDEVKLIEYVSFTYASTSLGRLSLVSNVLKTSLDFLSL